MYVAPADPAVARALRRRGTAPRVFVSLRVPATPRQWRSVRGRVHGAARAWACGPAPLRVSAHRAADHAVVKQYRYRPPPALAGGGDSDSDGAGESAAAAPPPALDAAAVEGVFRECAAAVEAQHGVRLALARVAPPAPAEDGSLECTVHYHVSGNADVAFASVQPAESTTHFLNANNLLSEMKTSAEQVVCGASYDPKLTVRLDAAEGSPAIRVRCREGVFAVQDHPGAAFRIENKDPLDAVQQDRAHRQQMELEDRTRAWQEAQAAPPEPPGEATEEATSTQASRVIQDVLDS